MSPEEIRSELDTLSETVGQHADELRETQRDRQELARLRQEVTELRALIHSLAGATKYAEAIFQMVPVPNERMQDDRRKFSQGLADIYIATDPR